MKYELLKDQSIELASGTAYRIKALKSFGKVEKGEVGGYVESEENLSQEGDCWIGDKGIVCGKAKVYDNAQIHDHAIIMDNAKVYGNCGIMDNAKVYGKVQKV